MSAGTVIEVHRLEREGAEGRVPVVTERDLECRYEQLLALVLRMGSWLTGPRARLLPADRWDEFFIRYQDQLEQLRRLGDELRPVSLRDRAEPLAGDALVGEVAELFA
jgi:hypothetical protein